MVSITGTERSRSVPTAKTNHKQVNSLWVSVELDPIVLALSHKTGLPMGYMHPMVGPEIQRKTEKSTFHEFSFRNSYINPYCSTLQPMADFKGHP